MQFSEYFLTAETMSIIRPSRHYNMDPYDKTMSLSSQK